MYKKYKISIVTMLQCIKIVKICYDIFNCYVWGKFGTFYYQGFSVYKSFDCLSSH